MTKTAGKLQLAYQDPRNAQLIGAGVLASGGLAAATGATAIAEALASTAKTKNIEENLSEN